MVDSEKENVIAAEGDVKIVLANELYAFNEKKKEKFVLLKTINQANDLKVGVNFISSNNCQIAVWSREFGNIYTSTSSTFELTETMKIQSYYFHHFISHSYTF